MLLCEKEIKVASLVTRRIKIVNPRIPNTIIHAKLLGRVVPSCPTADVESSGRMSRPADGPLQFLLLRFYHRQRGAENVVPELARDAEAELIVEEVVLKMVLLEGLVP